MDLGFFTKRMLAGATADAASDLEQARLIRELRAAAPLAGGPPAPPAPRGPAAGSFHAAAARAIRADPGTDK